MKTLFKVCIAVAIIISIPIIASAAKFQRLFTIENNLIRSKVVYGIRLNNNYKITQKNPIYNYWLRPSGSTRSVKWYERRGYGISFQKLNSEKSIKMALTPYPGLAITVLMKNKKAIPYIKLNNKNLVLIKIYVFAEDGVFGPNTKKVVIHTKDPLTNKIITRRIK